MSTNNILNESLNNTETDVYSLEEIIESEKEQNEIANAVLGASDDQNCSYKQGYVYRQALYCCLTCLNSSADKKLHGICLACSYECHQNHELIELYTKRNFRCDCGNSKFSIKCKLEPEKEPLNNNNKYNHNFNGLYCSCNRPYPDPELSQDDTLNNEEMIQCTLCEDWFHLKHLKGADLFKSNEDDYEDLICQGCMLKNQFIWFYQDFLALKDKLENGLVDVENVQSDVNLCKLKSLKKNNCEEIDKNWKDKELSCFLIDGWRENLCKCDECMRNYKDMDIEFIIRHEDSIKYYEECGKKMDEMNKCEMDEQKLLNNELSKMNRVSQVEFLHNLNDFKTDLKDFLADFARNGQVVKRENIEAFFESLNEQRKKKRVQF